MLTAPHHENELDNQANVPPVTPAIGRRRMQVADDFFAKAIGRRDRENGRGLNCSNPDCRRKQRGQRDNLAPREHHGYEETDASFADVTAACYAVKLVVYSRGTIDIDSPAAKVQHV